MQQISIPYLIVLILRKIGMWPGVSNITANLIISAAFIFCFIFQFWDAFLVHRDLISLMSSLCATIAEMMFFIKFLALWKKHWYVKNILLEIINDCKEIQIEAEETIILEVLRFANYFFLCSSCIYLSTGAFFVLTAAVSYNTENREFILDSAFPFEAYKSPVFELISFIQFFTTFVATFGNASIDGLFIMMVLHGSAKIDMVRGQILRFSNIANLNEKNKFRTLAIRNLVEKYQKAIEFTQKIEFIYTYQLLVQVILSTLEICATGFTFITLMQDNSLENVSVTKMMKFMVFFIAGLWVTGVYCTGGDYLRSKNELIQRDIYSSTWYELRPTECKSLCILMIRSQRPMTITAGKFINMTLYSYTSILKSAASYLSVLRAIN